MYDALKVAYGRLGELETEMRAVPVLRTINMPVLRIPEPDMDGLHGLDTPGGFGLGGFSSRGVDKYGNDVYGSADRETPPERSVEEFIDLSALTPAAIERLQQKERDAAKAVEFAENLCTELLAGRCE